MFDQKVGNSGSPQKGPNAQLSPSWMEPMAQAGLKLGPSPSRWTPNSSHVRRSCSTWRSLGWAPLATASRQVGPTETQHGEHCSMRSVTDAKRTWEIPVKMHFLTMSHQAGNVPHVEPMWGSIWAEVAWGQVAACGTQAGTKLEPNGSKLGPRWGLVGHSWPQSAPQVADIWGPNVNFDDVAPICKRCKLPQ